jgi:glycosyltransferase involved in cell wall biosynthesis
MFYIITEYFHPFSDAGGPVRSIENILSLLKPIFNITLLTSNKDYKGNILPEGIKSDIVQMEPKTGINTLYISTTLKGLITSYNTIKCTDTVYINGLFKPSLNLLPIIKSNNLIVAPRGMLQKPLLKQKWFQKRLYLFVLKFIFFFKNVKWHATTEQEAFEIKSVFGDKSDINVISNIPVNPYKAAKRTSKDSRTLSLVYYGLIVENKGLLTLIQTLKLLNLSISLDIYGSIKDQSYWEKCLQEIYSNNSLATINYLGHANPSESQTILAKYDTFILLTKGENFGHSIYESLSVGTPVIITNTTPWKFEDSFNPPGWIINYDDHNFDIDILKQTLTNLYHMDNDAYALSSKAAHAYAIDFYNRHDFKKEYTDLFNSFDN